MSIAIGGRAGLEPGASKAQRILLVASRRPMPVRRGDQLRAVQFARTLSREHRVDMLAPGPETEEGRIACALSGDWISYRRSPVDRLRGLLSAAIGPLPLQSGLYGSGDLVRQLTALVGRYDVVVTQMVRLSPLVARLTPHRVVVDLIDALSVNFARRAILVRRNPPLSKLLQREALALGDLEQRVLEWADATTVVCRRDRAFLLEGADPRRRFEHGRVRVGDLERPRSEPSARADSTLFEVGVPLRAVSPEAADACNTASTLGVADSAARFDLVMTGNLGYWVNRDALDWWLREIWPALRARRPALRWCVAGDRPARGLERRLAEAGATVLPAPDDLRAVLRRGRVAVAPLRGGAGVPVKILEAMAEGVPVVATPWAAAGVCWEENAPLLLATTAESWVQQVLLLLDDEELSRELASRGREMVRRSHTSDRCDQQLARVIDSVRRGLVRREGRRENAHAVMS